MSCRRRSVPRRVSCRSAIDLKLDRTVNPGARRDRPWRRPHALPRGVTQGSCPAPSLPAVETFVVRVWLPDRPGALGQVASRIGAVRGDVVGIDILERGANRAIDELVVQLPDASLVDLLVAEIRAVDGVDVEDVRPAAEALRDPRLDALETAAMLVG